VADFSVTDLNTNIDEVIEAALRGPVDIVCQGKRKFVLLTADDYDRLTADRRRVFHADEVPIDVAALMLSALERGKD
jgi:antitoxin Phd